MTKTGVKISSVEVEKRAKLDLSAGNTVKVWQKITEKGKTRLQAFEGLVIARKHGSEAGGTFTVRKVASGVGVEKIFPLYSPNIDRIEILRRAKVRRAKLYHIREKVAKEVRRAMRNIQAPRSSSETEVVAPLSAEEEQAKIEAAVAVAEKVAEE